MFAPSWLDKKSVSFSQLLPRYQIVASLKAWEMSVGVCKEAKTKANVGSISFQETRRHISFLIDQEEGELHFITAHTAQIIRLSCYREASWTIIAKPLLNRKSLSCLSEPGGQHLAWSRAAFFFLFSCRHNFPQRFINLIVRSIPPELLQGKFLLGLTGHHMLTSCIIISCLKQSLQMC